MLSLKGEPYKGNSRIGKERYQHSLSATAARNHWNGLCLCSLADRTGVGFYTLLLPCGFLGYLTLIPYVVRGDSLLCADVTFSIAIVIIGVAESISQGLLAALTGTGSRRCAGSGGIFVSQRIAVGGSAAFSLAGLWRGTCSIPIIVAEGGIALCFCYVISTTVANACFRAVIRAGGVIILRVICYAVSKSRACILYRILTFASVTLGGLCAVLRTGCVTVGYVICIGV